MYYSDTSNTATTQVVNARDALLGRVLAPAPVFTLHDSNDDERESVERFVADRFCKDYGADIHEFLPLLMSMRCLNKYSGIIGLRAADASPLFLEHYLDDSIECSVSAAAGEQVARRDIVEIGNLVASRKGPSQFVFLIATAVLHAAGYQWITFTATQTLANNLGKLGFPMFRLAAASAGCLPKQKAKEWGSYYQTCPQVFAGSLDAAVALAHKRPLFRRVTALYRREIQQLADKMADSRR